MDTAEATALATTTTTATATTPLSESRKIVLEIELLACSRAASKRHNVPMTVSLSNVGPAGRSVLLLPQRTNVENFLLQSFYASSV